MRYTASIRRAIAAREATVVVVGQGYVGLSLASVAASNGFTVVGIDLDDDRVTALESGRMVVPGVDEGLFATAHGTGRLAFSPMFDPVADATVVCICVPTPVRDGTPDLSYIERATKDVAVHLQPGTLVILESTTYPGTTEELVRPLLETSGLVAGVDFLLAYSPERIDPGNTTHTFAQVPRVVGGDTTEATAVAGAFYGELVEEVVQVGSCRAAELAKLLENTFRHVNIALVNELAMVCHQTGIDVWEVIDAAASKPFGFMRFLPGPGVGGHCIPLDPTYLTWQTRRDLGHQFRMVEQAEDINAQMPAWTASRIGDVLNDRGKPVRGSRILVLGVTYKPDVGDVRESPSVRVMELLASRGADLAFHDPFVDALHVGERLLMRSDLTTDAVQRADLVALLTPHATYDLGWLTRHVEVLFDARNACARDDAGKVVVL